MVKVVIGLTGTMGAGKDVVRDYLKQKYNCFYVKMSDVLMNELERKKYGLDRKLLQDSGDDMRKKYGGYVLAKVSIDYLPRDRELIVVDGIRNPGEIAYLKKTFGRLFVLIAIDSPPEMRFERLVKRGRPGDPNTLEEFQELDNRDQGTGQPDYGQQTRRCIEQADFLITNDGTFDDFQKKIAETVQKLFGG